MRDVPLVGQRLGQVGLEVVGEVVDLLRAQVREAAAHRRRVPGDVERVGGVQHAHRTTSVLSRRPMVPANSCQSLRCASSIARPCALMP